MWPLLSTAHSPMVASHCSACSWAWMAPHGWLLVSVVSQPPVILRTRCVIAGPQWTQFTKPNHVFNIAKPTISQIYLCNLPFKMVSIFSLWNFLK
jgi:hypothetical protein